MSKVIEIEKVESILTGELSYMFIEQVNEEGDPYEVIFSGEDTNFPEAAPMKIEDLEKHLQMLKSKGCNYVSLDYNIDHYEYSIDGYKVEVK